MQLFRRSGKTAPFTGSNRGFRKAARDADLPSAGCANPFRPGAKSKERTMDTARSLDFNLPASGGDEKTHHIPSTASALL